MDEKYLMTLKNMPIFGGLKSKTLEFFLSASEIETIKAGEYFFREGDKGNCVYVIQHGKVQVVKSCEGSEYILCVFHGGDCFGEMELIDMTPRCASIVAVEDTEVIKLQIKTIHALVQNDLEDYALIMMNMGREVSRRLRVADDLLLKERTKSGELKKV